MKKLMYIELGVLALLLVVAVVVCFSLSGPVFTPDAIVNTTTNQTEASTTETTVFVPVWNTYPASRQLLAPQYFVYD